MSRSEDIERIILGTLLLYPNCIKKYPLPDSDFGKPQHRTIYQALSHLGSNGSPVDCIVLSEHLKKLHMLEFVGGEDYLDGMMELVPSAGMIEEHIRILHNRAVLRKIKEGCAFVGNLADTSEDVTKVLEHAAKITEVATSMPEFLQPKDRSYPSATEERERLEWLWEGKIAKGALNLIAGEPGLGKSLVTIDVAARVSQGRAFPCEYSLGREPENVLMVFCEDSHKNTIGPRLDVAGADCWKVHILPNIVSIVNEVHIIEEAVVANHCSLVIIDPITAFLGSGKEVQSNNNSEVRAALLPITRMAERTGAAILMVTHFNKGTNPSAINRIIGSIAFSAAARAAHAILRDEENPSRILMLPAKINNAPDQGGFAYHIEGEDTPFGNIGKVIWENDMVNVNVNAVLGQNLNRGPKPDTINAAKDYLMELLTSGPVRAKEAEDGRPEGISLRTLRRAKDALGATSSKTGNSWMWTLPGAALMKPREAREATGAGMEGQEDPGKPEEPKGEDVIDVFM